MLLRNGNKQVGGEWHFFMTTPKRLEPKTIRKVQNSRNYLQQFFLINMQIWIHMYNQKLLFCVYYHVHSQ